MTRLSCFLLSKIVLVLLVLIYIYNINYKSTELSTDVKQLVNEYLNKWDVSRGKQDESRENQSVIPHLAFTLCGDRFIEAWNMLKSAILFTKTFLIVHIFSDTDNQMDLRQWDLLTDVDAVIYADIDTLFLAPVEELWSFFTKFNSTQVVAAVPVSDQPNHGLYFRERLDIPIIGTTGINSGLLLLNLTRLRQSTWASSVMETVMGLKQGLMQSYGDQDILNRYLNKNPEQAYLLPCEWNYRRGSECICKNATTAGAAILHGTTFSFITNKYPPLKAVFLAFKQFDFELHNLKDDLLENIKTNLDAVEPSSYADDIDGLPGALVDKISLLPEFKSR